MARPPSFAADNNEFAFDMYGHLRQQPGNLVFSPLSIRTVLAMAEAGARGETAVQMRNALCISSPEKLQHGAFATAIARLNRAADAEYEVAVANSLWGQEGAPLLAEFLDVIARLYDGTMNHVDFQRRMEAARAINRWVETQTRKNIRELISSDSLHADTRLVLVNAVYFKGKWELQFDKAATRDEPFHSGGGGKVRAPLMHQKERVEYIQGNGYQADELLFRGGEVSLLILLPDRKDGLQELEQTLDARVLDECVAQLVTRTVNLFLPRFKMRWGTVDARDPLTALGMTLAFTRFQADFSGINGHGPSDEDGLFISGVFHQAMVDVNEEGAEAAAATALVMTMAGLSLSTPPQVPTFRADHPFLFAIRDRWTGAILFLGRVADPTREG